MKSKQQASNKVLDVSRPKKRTTASDALSARPLVIPKRSIMVPVSDDPEEEAATGITPLQVKRVAQNIEPQTNPAPTEQGQDQTPKATAPQAQAGETTQDAAEEPASASTTPHVRKAVADAKREQEIQGYINDHEFFVPINAVARKRSLKVSVFLTFLELVLGVFLLNLMLDAGIIQLLEKIPHTNFFDLQ